MGEFKRSLLILLALINILKESSFSAAELMVANGEEVDMDILSFNSLLFPNSNSRSVNTETTSIEITEEHEDWAAEKAADKDEEKIKQKLQNELDMGNHTVDLTYEADYNVTVEEYNVMVEITSAYYCEKFGRLHNLCAYKANRTGMQYYLKGVNRTEQDFIMRFLITLRKRLLVGAETKGNPGPLPKAYRIRTLKWNQELAVMAQRVANQCRGTLNTSVIMSTDSFSTLTTTIAMSRDTVSKPRWTHALLLWYKSVENIRNDVIFRRGEQMDMYSAMVWGNSGWVGCGFTACRGNRKGVRVKIYVCVFGPGGNINRDKIYATSKADLEKTRTPESCSKENTRKHPPPAAKTILAATTVKPSKQKNTTDRVLATTVEPTKKKNPFPRVIFKDEWELG